jgi:hypothetical protein
LEEKRKGEGRDEQDRLAAIHCTNVSPTMEHVSREAEKRTRIEPDPAADGRIDAGDPIQTSVICGNTNSRTMHVEYKTQEATCIQIPCLSAPSFPLGRPLQSSSLVDASLLALVILVLSPSFIVSMSYPSILHAAHSTEMPSRAIRCGCPCVIEHRNMYVQGSRVKQERQINRQTGTSARRVLIPEDYGY